MPPKRKQTPQEEIERKQRRAEAERNRRAAMTPEQREQAAEARRNYRASMTPEQREQAAEARRNDRAGMTQEQRNQVAETQRNYRASMTQEVREQAAEAERNRRAAMTQEQRDDNNETTQIQRANTRNRIINSTIRSASNDAFNDSGEQHHAGEMNILCRFCNSKNFKAEQPQDKLFTKCCQKGKVVLPQIKTAPIIEQLMKRHHQHSKNFHENIRSLNSALAFASMGANIAPPPGYGPYCFRINGQIYHRAGALHPTNEDQRKFAQLYILDPDEAAEQRMRQTENQSCNAELMTLLSEFMANNSPFAEACKMLYEVEQECINEAALNGVEPASVLMAIVQDRKQDQRRYNAPRTNEVAVIFQNSDGEPPLERDLLIHCKLNETNNNPRKTERISVLDPNLEPMIYPLLFPYGDQSWSSNIPLIYRPASLLTVHRPPADNPRVRVTQMQYYGYRFAIRDGFNPFLSAGKLTQQYFVDAYVKTEANRLNFIRQNQSKLRVEKYTGLVDHLQSEAEAQGLVPGKSVILPSSFQGSPRNMNQNYQDAMAIVRKFGKPDYFITVTCNPKWPEITDNLEEGQSSEFRPDLVARVFKIKLDELLNDITKKHILGTPTAKVHVIEFQKRGLPHAHILIILKAEDKPKDPEKIDQFICAEIPDIQIHPRLYAIVTKHMIHGPCGAHNLNSPCMVDGKCSKEFPKTFQEETLANCNGYPKYRRRNDGNTATVNRKIINNTWVVPYNPLLIQKYNCHINIESCASIKSVKYLFKYVYKGHDCANIRIEETATLEHDEIKTFMDSIYVSAPEAAWRLFGHNMHDQSHTIVRLQVHLPDEQNVYFTEDNLPQILERAAVRDTTLTAWFKLNLEDETAQDILYPDIPQHFVFDNKNRKWKKRQRGADTTIGRMYAVSLSSDTERFCLRLLLLHVSGATSFENLKTFEGVTFPTFKEAAQRRGLFENDATWDQTLNEAVSEKMPKLLRELFACLCVFANPSNVVELFNKYKNDLWEDYATHNGHNNDCRNCEDFVLRDIQDVLILNGKKLADFQLRTPSRNLRRNEAALYDALVEQEKGATMAATLNAAQISAFDTVLAAVGNNLLRDRCFFLDGPGGSGKTYLYKTILSTIRGQNEICLPVASTGIAANLLEGGRTYHSQFKLPVPLLDTSTSDMRLASGDAKLIKQAKLLIWDESTMAPNDALRCVHTLLQGIMQNRKPFGGKVLLLGGDFRQTLPVVPHSSRLAIVEASIKFNQYWDKFKVLELQNNVRSVDPDYSDWLIKVGDGSLTNNFDLPENIIEIPAEMVCNGNLVTEIFGEKITAADVEKFAKVAIFCPKNQDVDIINEEILYIVERDTLTYLSADSIDDECDEDRQNYPAEFLNELTPSGMPSHKLNLKKECIIMLLRNLNTKRGLCNGTRLIVKDLKPNLIIAKVLTGSAAGQMVFIPRIVLAPSNSDLPFTLRRRQFPVKLAFAMTINKSQGQTLDRVGIYLPEPVFSHGQLYVGLSRVRSRNDVKVKIKDGPEQGKLIEGVDSIFTKNVVFKEIFSR